MKTLFLKNTLLTYYLLAVIVSTVFSLALIFSTQCLIRKGYPLNGIHSARWDRSWRLA